MENKRGHPLYRQLMPELIRVWSKSHWTGPSILDRTLSRDVTFALGILLPNARQWAISAEYGEAWGRIWGSSTDDNDLSCLDSSGRP